MGNLVTGNQDKRDADGLPSAGVSYYPATAEQMSLYPNARETLSTFQTPVLVHEHTGSNPPEKLYVAAFDGTGNDGDKDPEHATNVDYIRKQVKQARDPNISVGYIAGPGTQNDWYTRTKDGVQGFTTKERSEQMYSDFIVEAQKWKAQNPDVQISVASVGFSRGAEEAALFTRLVDERGIKDPASATYIHNSRGGIESVSYAAGIEPLVPPKQVAQAAVLFDPVGTGKTMDMDRRLPPSVISGIQLYAQDEQRSLFKVDTIIPLGKSEDGRFAGVMLPGSHSDVGGSYVRDGLSRRSGNIAIDYLNGLSDKPFLEKRSEPERAVVHNSREGVFIYKMTGKVDRREPVGTNTVLVSKGYAKVLGKEAERAEPINAALNQKFTDRRNMPNSPVPTLAVQDRAATPDAVSARNDQSSRPATPRSDVDRMFDQLHAASVNKSASELQSVGHDFQQSQSGQAWQKDIQQNAQAMQAKEQQATPKQPPAPQQQAPEAPTQQPNLRR